MTVIADTLKAKQRLTEAGFSDEKAEGIIAIFREADTQVATKLDLELFRKDIRAEIAELRSDMDSRFSELETTMLKLQFGGVVTTVVIILSAMKFLM